MIVQTSHLKGRESKYDRKPPPVFKPSGSKRPSLVEVVATATAAKTDSTADCTNEHEVAHAQYSTDNPLYHSLVPHVCSPASSTAPTALGGGTSAKLNLGISARLNLGWKIGTPGRWKKTCLARFTTPPPSPPADEAGSEEVFLPQAASGDEPCSAAERDKGEGRGGPPSSEVVEYMNVNHEGGAFAAARRSSADEPPPFCWVAALLVLDIVLIALAASLIPQLARTLSNPKGGAGDAGGLCTALTSPEAGVREREFQKPEDAAFCLPCLDLYLTALEVGQNRGGFRQQRMTNESMLCCVDSHDNLQGILKEYISVQYRTKRANGIALSVRDQTPPGEHLLLTCSTSTVTAVRNGAHVIPLIPLANSVIHQSKDFIFSLQNAKLSVKREGYYFVYSDIPVNYTFSPSTPPSTEPAWLKQEVVKMRNGGEETVVLLENSVLPCDLKSKQSCRVHSFASGTFRLTVGDSLFVQVSDSRNIIKDEVRFGLHPI